MKVLVTGVTGFVGQALVPVLAAAGHTVVGSSRDGAAQIPYGGTVAVDELGPTTDWSAALDGVEAVVHLAARVHVMNETASDPLEENRRINTRGTIKLAEDAATTGVRRFVFLSTIKVNGEGTAGTAFHADDTPRPQDPYAIAKHEAELALREICDRTDMESVIIRPPLVYGPGVGGNFLTLLKLCAKRLPLPLGLVNNRRSMIYVGNLTSAILAGLENPKAAGKTYLVGDGEDVSTPALIARISDALADAGQPGRGARLLPFPPGLLKRVAGLVGKSGAADRLLGDLCLDDTAIRDDLGWTPPFSMVQGLNETVRHFIATRKQRNP